jgi:hypothetical protein
MFPSHFGRTMYLPAQVYSVELGFENVLSYCREMMKNSQTNVEKVFLSETLKGSAVFQSETPLIKFASFGW